jgi:hypothetical protein
MSFKSLQTNIGIRSISIKLTIAVLKTSMLLYWFVTPCGIVGRHQRFGETYCLHRQGDSMFLQNFGIYLRVHTASQPRRTTLTSSPPWKAHSPEDRGSIFLRNVLMYVRVHTASQPKRTTSTSPPQWQPQISQTWRCSKFIWIFLIQILLTNNFYTVFKISLVVVHALHIIN